MYQIHGWRGEYKHTDTHTHTYMWLSPHSYQGSPSSGFLQLRWRFSQLSCQSHSDPIQHKAHNRHTLKCTHTQMHTINNTKKSSVCLVCVWVGAVKWISMRNWSFLCVSEFSTCCVFCCRHHNRFWSRHTFWIIGFIEMWSIFLLTWSLAQNVVYDTN